MTEQDTVDLEWGLPERVWSEGDHPTPMLSLPRVCRESPLVTRRLRLFAVAAASEVVRFFKVREFDEFLAGVEQRADGVKVLATRMRHCLVHSTWAYTAKHRSTTETRRALLEVLFEGFFCSTARWASSEQAARSVSKDAASVIGRYVSYASTSLEWPTSPSRPGMRKWQAGVLRDIFGNPFRPVTLTDAIRDHADGTPRRMAEVIYQERRWDQTGILADALEEAGCQERTLLDHLRDNSANHVRGCWAVDCVMGKE